LTIVGRLLKCSQSTPYIPQSWGTFIRLGVSPRPSPEGFPSGLPLPLLQSQRFQSSTTTGIIASQAPLSYYD
jgi:hypothetical protein